jgi:hypothetical protein
MLISRALILVVDKLGGWKCDRCGSADVRKLQTVDATLMVSARWNEIYHMMLRGEDVGKFKILCTECVVTDPIVKARSPAGKAIERHELSPFNAMLKASSNPAESALKALA